jgi:hypothetical protein
MDIRVSKRKYCLQVQYCSTFLYHCTNLSCNKAPNPWRTWPSYPTTKDSYVIHIPEEEKKKISFTFNVLYKNIPTLYNPNKAIKCSSTFQSSFPRFATGHCLLVGYQASPVCASDKTNMCETVGDGIIFTEETSVPVNVLPTKITNGLTQNQTRASAVVGRQAGQLNSWSTVRTL